MARLQAPRVPAAALAALAAAACGPGAPPAAEAWRLHREVALALRLQVAGPAGEPLDWARLAGARLAAQEQREVLFVAPGEPPAGEPAARIWIGGPQTPGADEALARLGVERYRTADGLPAFRFLGRAYEGPADALVATLADPLREELPLSLALGNDAAVAARCLEDLEPVWRAGFRTWRGGLLEREGDLEPDGRPLGEPRELLPERGPFEGERALEHAGLSVQLGGVSAGAAAAWLADCAAARARVLELLGARQAPPIRVRVHPDAERLAALTGAWLPARVAPDLAVDGLAAAGLPDDGGAAVARATALALLGPPREPWLLDAVGALAARTWWGVPRERWLAHLALGELQPDLAALVAPDAPESPHVLVPLRGLLLEILAEQRGAAGVVELWSGRARPELAPALRAAFAGRLAAVARAGGEEHDARSAQRRAAALGAPFRKGFALVAPFDPARQGFGTTASHGALQELAALGANAVAFDCVGVLEPGPPRRFGAHRPAWLPPPWADFALVCSARRARALGLDVMLAPNLLATPSGNTAGRVLVDSEAAWERHFAGLERFLVHCGLVAELGEAALLCLAREQPTATVTERDDGEWSLEHFARRAERWRRVARLARGAFHGALTYAAGGPGEASGIAFWSELDFVGVDLFESLARPPGSAAPPTLREASARIWEQLEQAAHVAREAGRPLLVTGIGFSASRAAWREPRRPWGEPDPAEQERLYVALTGALREARDVRPELAGAYLWSWRTEPRPRRPRGFSPHGRPAEARLEWLFDGL